MQRRANPPLAFPRRSKQENWQKTGARVFVVATRNPVGLDYPALAKGRRCCYCRVRCCRCLLPAACCRCLLPLPAACCRCLLPLPAAAAAAASCCCRCRCCRCQLLLPLPLPAAVAALVAY